MKLAQLQRRVDRAEDLVQGRMAQTRSHLLAAAAAWRRSWTPWRIVGAGAVVGFLVGKARPSRALAGGRWLQVAGSVASMVGSLQAALAAWQAEQDLAQADDGDPGPGAAADPPTGTAQPAPAPPSDPSSDAAVQQWRSSQPRAAEAATELSEH